MLPLLVSGPPTLAVNLLSEATPLAASVSSATNLQVNAHVSDHRYANYLALG